MYMYICMFIYLQTTENTVTSHSALNHSTVGTSRTISRKQGFTCTCILVLILQNIPQQKRNGHISISHLFFTTFSISFSFIVIFLKSNFLKLFIAANFYYTLHERSSGGIWNHSVRPSVCLSVCPSVCADSFPAHNFVLV